MGARKRENMATRDESPIAFDKMGQFVATASMVVHCARCGDVAVNNGDLLKGCPGCTPFGELTRATIPMCPDCGDVELEWDESDLGGRCPTCNEQFGCTYEYDRDPVWGYYA